MPDRDAEFTISATDRSARATDSAADNFEHLGREADRAKRKIDDLGDETGQLARKMAEARAAAAGLARQFDKTGDPKILRDFQKINAEAARLGRVAKSLKFDEPKIDDGRIVSLFRKTGLLAGDAAVSGIAEALTRLPPEFQAAGLAAGVVLVGGIEGAVTAGVAAGGIGAGLILAAQDDRVKAAYSDLGTNIMGELKTSAEPFRDELLDIPPALQKSFDKQLPRIKRIFQTLSQDIDPILDNVVESVDRIAPALERASAAGGKVLISLSGTLPALTGAIGSLLDSFSDSSSGAATSLNLLVLGASALIYTFATLTTTMNPLLIGLGKLGELTGITSENVKHLDTIQRGAGAGAGLTAQQYAMLGLTMTNTAVAAKATDEAFHRLFDTQMGVDQANLAVNLGMQQLTQTIKGNKKTLDESTESGAQNVSVILSQIQALGAKRDADIAAGNGTQEAVAKANAAYASNVAALRAVLIQLGLAPAAVDALIAKYQEIPKSITTTITTVYRTQGTPPGYSDEKTGHSRTGGQDYGGLDGWRPAQFAARSGAAFMAAGAATSSSAPPVPVEVHAEHSFGVYLDGQPFRAIVRKTNTAAEQRAAWRNKVGRR